MEETGKMYQKLLELASQAELQDRSMKPVEETVRKLYEEAGGTVFTTSITPAFLVMEGYIRNRTEGAHDYTLYNSFSAEYVQADLNRLVEDLTMGFYRVTGHKDLNTYSLIAKCKEGNS